MRNLKSFAFAAVGCVLLAGSLSAQTGTGKMKLSGVNGTWGCYSSSKPSSSECVYTSPYFGEFKNLSGPAALLPPGGGVSYGSPWDIFCVDFFHNAYIGQETNVYLTNLGHLSAGWLGTYTRSSSLQDYLEAAWLSQKILSVGVNTTASKNINGAIWQIMSGYTFYRGGSNTGIAYWVGEAQANYGTVNASNWVVVTPKGSTLNSIGNSQEFITQVTPEPATLLLMGTGLFGLLLAAGAIRRPLA